MSSRSPELRHYFKPIGDSSFNVFPLTDSFPTEKIESAGPLHSHWDYGNLHTYTGSKANAKADKDCIFNQAVRLTGNIGYQSHYDYGGVGPTPMKYGQWTWSAWFKLNKPLQGSVYLIGVGLKDHYFGWSGANGIFMHPTDNKITVEHGEASFAVDFDLFPLGSWNHIMTYTVDRGDRILYINGHKIGSKKRGTHGWWGRPAQGTLRASVSTSSNNDISVDLPAIVKGSLDNPDETAYQLYWQQRLAATNASQFGPSPLGAAAFVPPTKQLKNPANTLMYTTCIQMPNTTCANKPITDTPASDLSSSSVKIFFEPVVGSSFKVFPLTHSFPTDEIRSSGPLGYGYGNLQKYTGNKANIQADGESIFQQAARLQGKIGYRSVHMFGINHQVPMTYGEWAWSAWFKINKPLQGPVCIIAVGLYDHFLSWSGATGIFLYPTDNKITTEHGSVSFDVDFSQFSLGAWNHIMAYTVRNGERSLFVNGKKIGSQSAGSHTFWTGHRRVELRALVNRSDGNDIAIDLPALIRGTLQNPKDTAVNLYCHQRTLATNAQHIGFYSLFLQSPGIDNVPLLLNSNQTKGTSVRPILTDTAAVYEKAIHGQPSSSSKSSNSQWLVPYSTVSKPVKSPLFTMSPRIVSVWVMWANPPVGNHHTLVRIYNQDTPNKGDLCICVQPSKDSVLVQSDADPISLGNGFFSVLPLNQYHHFAAVYQKNNITLYLNGQLIGQTKVSTADWWSSSNGVPVNMEVAKIPLQNTDGIPSGHHNDVYIDMPMVWASSLPSFGAGDIFNVYQRQANAATAPKQSSKQGSLSDYRPFIDAAFPKINHHLGLALIFPDIFGRDSDLKPVYGLAAHSNTISYTIGGSGNASVQPKSGIYAGAFYSGDKGSGELVIRDTSGNNQTLTKLLNPSAKWTIAVWVQIKSYPSTFDDQSPLKLIEVLPSDSNKDNSNGLCVAFDYRASAIQVLKKEDNDLPVILRPSCPPGQWFCLTVSKTDDATFTATINGYRVGGSHSSTVTTKQTSLPTWWGSTQPNIRLGNASNANIPFYMDKFAWIIEQ